ncbi:MAG: hypothetical protein J0L84_15925 [Verrucomicrobia bacterium]|nr:hypothetical protein [Verrucomicrobiota bacterium]
MSRSSSMLRVLAVGFSAAWLAAASPAETLEYRSEARLITDRGPGAVAYLERHRVTLGEDGRPILAETRYESPDGRLLAELRSDFRESLTVPSHIATDHRTGNTHGLRREQGRLVLFDRMPDQPERTRVLTVRDAGDRLLVGCQGLNYYLSGNPDRIRTGSRLPLRFLIPGKLDYYDFSLVPRSESPEGIAAFDVTIQNWFLRLFAPKLELKYDTRQRRLTWYRGISNILNDRGENQVVEIHYTY